MTELPLAEAGPPRERKAYQQNVGPSSPPGAPHAGVWVRAEIRGGRQQHPCSVCKEPLIVELGASRSAGSANGTGEILGKQRLVGLLKL